MASEEHVDRFVRLLGPGGVLHVATDIDDYVAQVERVCDAHPDLEGGAVDRPAWRPVTRYERKAIDAGRTVTDLLYRTPGNDADARIRLVPAAEQHAGWVADRGRERHPVVEVSWFGARDYCAYHCRSIAISSPASRCP